MTTTRYIVYTEKEGEVYPLGPPTNIKWVDADGVCHDAPQYVHIDQLEMKHISYLCGDDPHPLHTRIRSDPRLAMLYYMAGGRYRDEWNLKAFVLSSEYAHGLRHYIACVEALGSMTQLVADSSINLSLTINVLSDAIKDSITVEDVQTDCDGES